MREISPCWENLMMVAKRIDFGEAKVVFQNGEPIRIDAAVKRIQLNDSESFKDDLKTIPLT